MLGTGSLLLFVQSACLFSALYRLSSTRYGFEAFICIQTKRHHAASFSSHISRPFGLDHSSTSPRYVDPSAAQRRTILTFASANTQGGRSRLGNFAFGTLGLTTVCHDLLEICSRIWGSAAARSIVECIGAYHSDLISFLRINVHNFSNHTWRVNICPSFLSV